MSSLDFALQSLSLSQDNDVLQAVDEAATTYPESQRLQSINSSLWEKTLKARPNDDGLLQELFERRVFAQDWDGARKVCWD